MHAIPLTPLLLCTKAHVTLFRQLGETKEMEISGWLDKDKVPCLYLPFASSGYCPTGLQA